MHLNCFTAVWAVTHTSNAALFQALTLLRLSYPHSQDTVTPPSVFFCSRPLHPPAQVLLIARSLLGPVSIQHWSKLLPCPGDNYFLQNSFHIYSAHYSAAVTLPLTTPASALSPTAALGMAQGTQAGRLTLPITTNILPTDFLDSLCLHILVQEQVLTQLSLPSVPRTQRGPLWVGFPNTAAHRPHYWEAPPCHQSCPGPSPPISCLHVTWHACMSESLAQTQSKTSPVLTPLPHEF